MTTTYTKSKGGVDGFTDEHVQLLCDMCGAECPHSKARIWEDSFGIKCITCVEAVPYTGDEENDKISVDLCPKCVLWLMSEVKSGKVRRP